MAKFIVIQMCIEKEEKTFRSNNVNMINIVRQVDAENKEAAIGKFILATERIVVKQKLNIECYDLTELNSL